MPTTCADERLSRLSQSLWRQRARVEVLLYRLEVQQLVLAAGRSGLVDRSARDVEDAIDDLRTEEVVRAAHVAAVAPTLGVGSDARLSILADAAGDPWSRILRDHRASFLALVGAIESASRDNRELLSRGLRDSSADTRHLGRPSSSGTVIELTSILSAVGDVERAEALIEGRVREMVYEAALHVTEKVAQPTLIDFLR